MRQAKQEQNPALKRVLNALIENDARDNSITTVIEKKKRRPLSRQERKRPLEKTRIVAWDLETTRIAEGTPEPLYITAYGENPDYSLKSPIRDMAHLSQLMIEEMLTPRFIGIKFVAWNSNNFDSYIAAAAILMDPRYVIRPYLNKSNQLRGMRVMLREEMTLSPADQKHWEFVDGMSMLGLTTTSLEKFLDTFAPDTKKLVGNIDFSKEEFDARKQTHRDYAMRDSVGLYKGMVKAQEILYANFNQPLTVTIGNACIKIFKAHIPEGVFINPLEYEVERVVREYVMRGGFCFCTGRYHGPVWKYDLNQAYAAAMREARIPQGRTIHCSNGVNQFAIVYIARVSAINLKNKVPFYYCGMTGARLRAKFATTEISETWLTSIEIEQLKSEGWKINVHESYCWEDSFRMTEFVDKLEHIRTTAEGGPSGPVGTVIKAVGNNAYGKTVSQAPGESLLLSKLPPDGYEPYYGDGVMPVENVWHSYEDPSIKDYEQPHIGAFITAHVRMVVRRAALLAPDAWIYADTDCVVFTRDMTKHLDIDPGRYGAWKLEESGTVYRFIAKKVYQNMATEKGNAKGLNVRRLTSDDFEKWFDGVPPTQTQVQRNNFVKVMAGMSMYRTQVRRGTSVDIVDRENKSWFGADFERQ